MIAVCNISEEKGVVYARKGLQHYRVQLNQIHLAEFDHMAEDGMVVCMEKSAKALEGVDIDAQIKKYERARFEKLVAGML